MYASRFGEFEKYGNLVSELILIPEGPTVIETEKICIYLLDS